MIYILLSIITEQQRRARSAGRHSVSLLADSSSYDEDEVNVITSSSTEQLSHTILVAPNKTCRKTPELCGAGIEALHLDVVRTEFRAAMCACLVVSVASQNTHSAQPVFTLYCLGSCLSTL